PKVELIRDELVEQTEGQKDPPPAVAVNRLAPAPRVPPMLLESLPQLPAQVEFDFVGRTLILRDVDADVVIDFVPEAFPEPTPATTDVAPSGPAVTNAANAPRDMLAMPAVAGATTFALMGDS